MFFINQCPIEIIIENKLNSISNFENYYIIKKIENIKLLNIKNDFIFLLGQYWNNLKSLNLSKLVFVLFDITSNCYYKIGSKIDINIIDYLFKKKRNLYFFKLIKYINKNIEKKNDFNINSLKFDMEYEKSFELYKIKKYEICSACLNDNNNDNIIFEKQNKQIIEKFCYNITPLNFNEIILNSIIDKLILSNLNIKKKLKFIRKELICNCNEFNINTNDLINILILFVSMISNEKIEKEFINMFSQTIQYIIESIEKKEKSIIQLVLKLNLNEIKLYFCNKVIININDSIKDLYINKYIMDIKNYYLNKHENHNIVFKIDIKNLNYLSKSDFKNSSLFKKLRYCKLNKNNLYFGYKELKFVMEKLSKLKMKNNIKLLKIKYDLCFINKILFNKLYYTNMEIEVNNISNCIKKDKKRLQNISKLNLGNEKYEYFLNKINHFIDYDVVILLDKLFSTFNYNLLKFLNIKLIEYNDDFRIFKVKQNYKNKLIIEPNIFDKLFIKNKNNSNDIDYYDLNRKIKFDNDRTNSFYNYNNNIIENINLKELLDKYLPKCIKNAIEYNCSNNNHLNHFKRYDLLTIIYNLKINEENKKNIWFEIFKYSKDHKININDKNDINSFYDSKYGNQFLILLNDDKNHLPHNCNMFKIFCPYSGNYNDNNNNNNIIDIEEIHKAKCTDNLNEILNQNDKRKINSGNIKSPISYHFKSFIKFNDVIFNKFNNETTAS